MGRLSGPDPASLDQAVTAAGRLFFVAGADPIEQKLWVSDGSAAGTVVIGGGAGQPDPREPTQLTPFKGGVAFAALDGQHGRELWSSDGTSAGTRLIADLGEGALGIYPNGLTAAGGRLFFVPSPDYRAQLELWSSDGTSAGTRSVKVLPTLELGTQVNNLTSDGAGVYFSVDDSTASQLWFSDGTEAGTKLISEFSPTLYYAPTRDFTVTGGHLFFIAYDVSTGQEVWVSDGTTAGTRLLKDINPGLVSNYSGSYPSDLTAVNGQLFFVAFDEDHGVELWKSDGTEAGTVLVKDINPEPGFGGYPQQLMAVGQTLFFTALSDSPDGLSFDLWSSDGTEAGTRIVSRLNREGDATGFYPRALAPAGSRLVFVSDSPDHNDEIWITDGSAAGTSLLTLAVPSSEHDPSVPSSLILGGQVVNGQLLYQSLTSSDLLSVPLGPEPAASQLSVVGGLVLLQDGNGRFWVSRDGGPATGITWGGAALNASTLPAWQLLAAAEDRGNMLLWRNRSSGEIVTWTLDDWTFTGGSAPMLPSSADALRLESRYQTDLNGDRIIGATRTVLSRGGDQLSRRTGDDGLTTTTTGGTSKDLKWGGQPLQFNDKRLPGWSALATASINGVTSLLWWQNGSGNLATWSFDTTGNASGGTDPVPSSSDQASRFEIQFGIDANGDRAIGSPRVPVASAGDGAEALYCDAFSRRLTTETGTPLLWGGAPLLEKDPRLVGWTAVAFRSIGGNRLLWREEATGNLAQWTFDASGSATGGTAPVGRFSAEAYGYESDYSLDANGDRSIGSPWQPIAYSVNGLSNPSNRWLLQRNSSSNVLGVSLNNGPVLSLSWGGSLLDGDPRLAGWTAVAATSEVSTNKLLWRQEGSGNLASWTFDANWSAVSGAPAVGPNSPDAYALERSFGIDANRDGTIGNPGAAFAVVSSIGTITLQRSLNGNRLSVADNGAVPVDLFWGGSALTAPDPRLGGWTAIAAARLDGVNSLLWRETATNNLATWSFDSLWRATGGTAPVASTSAAAYGYESRYGLDLNGDRSIGLPFTVISSSVISSSSGGSSLVRLAGSRQLAISSAGGAITPLRWGGVPLLDGDARLTGWSALAVIPATATTGHQLLWQQAGSGQAVTWTFDSNGTAISGSDPISAGSTGFNGLEQSFQVDLNGDRCIGNPYTTLAVSGAIALQRHSSSGRLAISSNGGAAIGLSWGGSDLLDGDSRLSGWTAIAAARVNGTNQLLWRQSTSGNLTTWTFDDRWNPSGGTAIVTRDSQDAITLEEVFGLDANDDGAIGEPLSPIERLRGLIVAAEPNANARDPFTAVVSGGAFADDLVAPVGDNAFIGGADLLTGIALPEGSIGILDAGLRSSRTTVLLASPTDLPYPVDGDRGYTLVRNLDPGRDDLVLPANVAITSASRTLTFQGAAITGLGLHVDSNGNGSYDSGDDLIALLAGISTTLPRTIRI